MAYIFGSGECFESHSRLLDVIRLRNLHFPTSLQPSTTDAHVRSEKTAQNHLYQVQNSFSGACLAKSLQSGSAALNKQSSLSSLPCPCSDDDVSRTPTLTIDEGLIPAPLRLRSKIGNQTDRHDYGVNRPDWDGEIIFPGDAYTMRHHGVYEMYDNSQQAPKIKDVCEVPGEPRLLPKTFRPLQRWSLTPSEVSYHNRSTLLRAHTIDASKAELGLGLRRPTKPPSLPPKAPSRVTGAAALPFNYDIEQNSRPVGPHWHGHVEPLNGTVAWLHAVTGLFVVFNCWGLGNAFGLFQDFYETAYLRDSSAAAIAWIGSTQLALVFGMGVPVGNLVDRGYFRAVFHSGTAVMVLGLLLSAWCDQWWSLWLVQGFVTGLGMGAVFCSGIVAVMTWFDDHTVGLAMGFSAAGSCIGGIVYVLLARHLLVARGFAFTMRVLAAVAAITMLPANLVFRVRGDRNRCHRLRRRSGKVVVARPGMVRRTFAEPSYLLAASGMFFAFLGVYFGFVYMVSYGRQILNLSYIDATDLLIFMLVANLLGRFLPALISDKCIGPLNTLIPSVFLSSAVVGLWATSSPSEPSLIVVACFYGFVSAGVQVLYAPTVYSFCIEPVGRADAASVVCKGQRHRAADRIGVKAGGIFTCIGLACLIGIPTGGALISYRTDRNMSKPFLGAQIFAASSLLVGGVFLLASRVLKIGWAARRA